MYDGSLCLSFRIELYLLGDIDLIICGNRKVVISLRNNIVYRAGAYADSGPIDEVKSSLTVGRRL